MPKPVLTIGMIVKNEIRCLERCLKALQPLRDALPCELIIADTGSDDGTREIAEKYADLVFDFPWINDFSAARNSVMDRASGEWFISVDADEYLDEDCSEIVNFLKNAKTDNHNFCGVIVRNYATMDLVGPYNDFMAIRMARMSIGARYHGTIHEMWTYPGHLQVHGLKKTVFHHDGYVGFGTESSRAKQKRNMDLLKSELKRDPHNLKTLMQAVDSSVGTDEHLYYIRAALKGVRKKNQNWQELGPVIFRSAVSAANVRKMDEFWDWVKEAEELYPNSLYVNISINRTVLTSDFQEKNYSEVIRRGERYIRAMEEYNSGNFNPAELCYGALDISPEYEDAIRILMADACFHERQNERARDTLAAIDGSRLSPGLVSNYTSVMLNLQAQSDLDLRGDIVSFWEQIQADKPRKDWGMLRQNAVMAQAGRAYTEAHRAEEARNNFRHAYTLFLPLKGECELGNAAAVLESRELEEQRQLLCSVKKWDEFPIPALSHALQCGVQFPIVEQPLNMETMDILASQLESNGDNILTFIEDTKDYTGFQASAWRKALAIAAVRASKWEDKKQGMELAQVFARMEQEFLQISYTPEALDVENVYILPPMHRFGVYCIKAFQALEKEDLTSYVRQLRKGLTFCEGMKPMVEFLIKNTPELQSVSNDPNPELLVLAQKVRLMLAQYAPGTPAVEAIKNTEAYQKVAHLIEGVEVVAMGGLVQ